jgi:hypothetical protein
MKHKNALQPLFDALRDEAEPISPDRQARTLTRFLKARHYSLVQGKRASDHRLVADFQPEKPPKPRPNRRADKPKGA